MKALIAIHSFKGSITSIEAPNRLERGFTNAGIQCEKVAIADGGEGTVDSFLFNRLGGFKKTFEVHDVLNNKVSAPIAWFPSSKTAVIECASASGIQFKNQYSQINPTEFSSVGTGELIKNAIDLGAKTIIVGLGGSGTVDAGLGLISGLGGRFLDNLGHEVAANLQQVVNIQHLNLSRVNLKNVQLIVASDVTGPLTGISGATQVFGAQKGLSENQIQVVDQDLKQLARVLDPKNQGKEPGDGAAGGMGFALRILGGKVESGFHLVSENADLESKVQNADIVITGEGRIDDQSLHGKVPVEVAKLAKNYQKPCIAFVGQQIGTLDNFRAIGLTSIFSIVDRVMTLDQAISQGPELLEQMAERVSWLIK